MVEGWRSDILHAMFLCSGEEAPEAFKGVSCSCKIASFEFVGSTLVFLYISNPLSSPAGA